MDSAFVRSIAGAELFAETAESAAESTARPRATVAQAAYEPTDHDVRQHMHLVFRVVAQMQRRLPSSVERDDLIAAGTMGLLDAIRKNHRELGSPGFECYARIRIRGAIVDDLRHLDWSPRRKKASCEGGNAMTPAVTIVALDDLNAGAADAESSSPCLMAERFELRRVVSDALAKLPERDRRVLELRYVHDVPAKEVAVMLGVSEARVSQLHTRATSTLRGLLSGYDLDENVAPAREAA